MRPMGYRRGALKTSWPTASITGAGYAVVMVDEVNKAGRTSSRFRVGERYTKADIYRLLDVPAER